MLHHNYKKYGQAMHLCHSGTTFILKQRFQNVKFIYNNCHSNTGTVLRASTIHHFNPHAQMQFTIAQ